VKARATTASQVPARTGACEPHGHARVRRATTGQATRPRPDP